MVLIIYVLLIAFIIWISCIPSGKSFLRKWIREYKKQVAAERELMAFGESAIQNNNFQLLMTQFKSLSTFSQVEQWDQEAEQEIIEINTQIQQLDCEVIQYQKVLAEWTLKKFNEKYKVVLEDMADKLQEAIDFTPNSPKEQKLLLKELRTQKKELQLQKREVTANMKAIRRDARIQSVHAGKVLFRYCSKSSARQRRWIRYEKEAKLRPHEDVLAAIERQILQIDKDIFWVESFEN